MGPVRYIVMAATLAMALTVLIVMAQSQYGTTQPTINLRNTTSTQAINCTQYGEFQGEFQCGEQAGIQVNATAYNVTSGMPYQYEDEHEASMED